MMNYNEPTLDPLFVEQVRSIRSAGLTPAVNSNGTGLTPKKVMEIKSAGGLGYLEINLSTLNREEYQSDRRGDHLPIVLRNLDYLSVWPIADRMEISVLGTGDKKHKQAFADIRQRYSHSPFHVRFGEVMDRAGNIDTGRRPMTPIRRLGGCQNNGSRVVEHLHVTPDAKCVVCCQDYFGTYTVGDLSNQSLEEVLTGEPFARVRRWAYGMEDAPRSFICRRCVYAVEAGGDV
jgi:hypothetical protein